MLFGERVDTQADFSAETFKDGPGDGSLSRGEHHQGLYRGWGRDYGGLCAGQYGSDLMSGRLFLKECDER